MFIRKAFAFIKRDFLIETSYRFSFFIEVFGIIITLLTFYFIGRLFDGRAVSHLAPYGGDYFSYVLLGLTLSNYIGISLSGIMGQINSEQSMGTLESLFVTPTKIWHLLLSMSLWGFVYNTIQGVFYILFGIIFFGVDLTNINLLSCFIIFFLTIITFSSLGLLSSAFILLFKRGDPVSWAAGTLMSLLGGVYFPVSVFPSWLKDISFFLPVTHSIQAMQQAVYKGHSPTMLLPQIGILVLFSLILVPTGFISFNYALKKAKKDGSLIQY